MVQMGTLTFLGIQPHKSSAIIGIIWNMNGLINYTRIETLARVGSSRFAERIY